MSEIGFDERKKIVLDRIATEIVNKELAEEKERALAEEKRLAHEAEQQAMLKEMSELLPAIVALEWKTMPEFLNNAGVVLQKLAEEYDTLSQKESELETRFRSLRAGYESPNEVDRLFSEVGNMRNTVEFPEGIKAILEYSYSSREVNRFFLNTLLRFLDFRFRDGGVSIIEINDKLR